MYRLAALALLFLALTVPTDAQTLGADPLTVDITPAYPQPYDTVTVTPQSTLFDINASTVTISVNGKVIQQGSGGQSGTFTAGAAGTTDTVTISASSPQGNYQKTITIAPASVALVEEPMSITHPFYEGASLPASQGRVRIVALPDIHTGKGKVDPSTLSYTWKLNDQILTAQSGIGRATLDIIAPIKYRDATISLAVGTPDGSVTGSASLKIAVADPLVVMYRSSPLFGPEFDTALSGTFSMSGLEETFRAVPYFLDTMDGFSWSLNGTPSITDPVITVRSTGDSAGVAQLVASAQTDSFQGAQTSLTVRFGTSSGGSGIFGL